MRLSLVPTKSGQGENIKFSLAAKATIAVALFVAFKTQKFYILQSKKSIARIKVKLKNNSTITIKGYDEMADWMYRNIGIKDKLIVSGRINTKMEIEAEWIKKS